jgi:broad specificity phosphatase PhoE
MSVMTLVRHGQASFFADDYDQLTPLGEEQSRRLGEYWVRHALVYDEVYTGPRSRQRRSAAVTGAAVREAGLAWPDPIVVDGLDEFDLDGILHRLAPELSRQDAAFAGLFERFRQSHGDHDRVRAFQRMFEALLIHWQSAPTAELGIESWATFRARVERTLRQIVERPGRSRRVALFTSGGIIGAATAWALGAPDRTALELSWRLRNSALTDFVFTENRLTVDTFNGVPHLADPALWTYR